MRDYFASYDLYYCGRLELDMNTFRRYRKLNVPVGYVRSLDVFPAGTDVTIRTLEGDAEAVCSPDIYFMIGISQEVYPIRAEKFGRSYITLDTPYAPNPEFLGENRYFPTVRHRVRGESVSLLPYVRACQPTGESVVWGRQLDKRAKVFTTWNTDGYMFGDVGDTLAVRADDTNDAYVIEQRIFDLTYAPAEG
jgi:phosphoglycolate phosphatase